MKRFLSIFTAFSCFAQSIPIAQWPAPEIGAVLQFANGKYYHSVFGADSWGYYDFDGANTSTGSAQGPFVLQLTTSTGAPMTGEAQRTAKRWTQQTAAGSLLHFYLAGGSDASIEYTSGDVMAVFLSFRVDSFYNHTNEVRIGFCDVIPSSSPTDAVMWRMLPSSGYVGTNQLQAVSFSNSTVETNSVVQTLSANTWYRVGVVIESSSRATFWIGSNFSSMSCVATNTLVPAGDGREFGIRPLSVYRTVASSATQLWDTDYMGYVIKWGASR